jgi:hypothetical protein
MAQVFGQESRYLKIQKNTNSVLAFLVFFCLILFLACYFVFNLRLESGGLFFFVSLILVPSCFALLILFIKYSSISGQFSKKIKGERNTLVDLRKLPFEYLIFRDVRLSEMRRNIDFVVVGSSGIFSIETKHRRGVIDMQRIKENDFIEQVVGGATELQEYIKTKTGREFPISPVLVFSKGFVQFDLTPVKGVYIIKRKLLEKLIRKEEINLKEKDIEAIKEVLLETVNI